MHPPIRLSLYCSFLIFCLLSLAPSAVKSQSFTEGTHYSKIEPNSAEKTSGIVEYFSFSCPGCYAIETHIKTLLKTRPSTKLKRVHVPFGGQKAKLSQKAFVLMALLNANQHKDAVFARIHKSRNVFDNEEELVDFFASLGYARETLEQTLNSFSADSMVRKMNQQAIKNQIRTVPTIVISGQYKVNVRAINSESYLTDLVTYLDALSNQ